MDKGSKVTVCIGMSQDHVQVQIIGRAHFREGDEFGQLYSV